MKRILSVLGILALVALGFGGGVLYMLVRSPTPRLVGQDAYVSPEANATATSTFIDAAGGYLDIRPQAEVNTLFIFYPGGLIRPQAYEWLGIALAPLGVRTVIVKMPLNLAVFAPERASKVLDSLEPQYQYVVIGGHSLGGAMAARYAYRHASTLDGLILMAAYPAENNDLSNATLKTLLLAAEYDGLVSPQEIETRAALLPKDTRFLLIEGAIHSFFGRYGPQRGDGVPKTDRADAEAQIMGALQPFFSEIAQERAALP